MMWFIQVAAWATGFLIAILVLDFLRRRGMPRLSLPTFRGSGIPDKLSLRLAKTVIDGDFDGSQFRKGAFRALFPTQIACPHCRGKSKGGSVWEIGRAERSLDDLGKLAWEIKRKRFCRSCLNQLGDVAKVRGKLKKLGKKDPRSLPSIRPKVRGCLLLLFWAVSTITILLVLSPGLLKVLLKIVAILLG